MIFNLLPQASRAKTKMTSFRKILFCTSGLLVAQIAPASADTLSEIYELALQNDPQLRSAHATYLAANENKALLRAGLLPSLIASGSYSESEDDGSVLGSDFTLLTDAVTDTDTTSYDITLSQPLFDLPAWFGFQQGKALSEQAAAQFAAERQAQIVRVVDAYLNVLRASENLATSEAEEEAVGRQLEQTRERYEVGLLPITDVHEAQSAYDNTVVNTLESRGALGIAFEALGVLTGQTHQQLAGLKADFPITKPEPLAREEWVNFALANNYALKAAQLARDAAEFNAKAKKLEHVPKVTASFTYQDLDSDSFASGVSTDFGSEGGGLADLSAPSSIDQATEVWAISVQAPIFLGGSISAQRRQAGHQAVAAEEGARLVQRNTIQQARSQHLSVVTNAERVKARQQAVISAESALEATQAGYEVGTRNIVDVLIAQRAQFQAKRNYANARYDYIGSMLALMEVAGQLSPDEIYKFDAWLNPVLSIERSVTQ